LNTQVEISKSRLRLCDSFWWSGEQQTKRPNKCEIIFSGM